MPAGLVTPNAAAAVVNLSKYPKRVRVRGVPLFNCRMVSLSKRRDNWCLLEQTALPWAQQAGERSLGRSSALFLTTSLTFPLSILIHLGSLLIHPYTSLPLSMPVRFLPPFIPGEMELEGFEKHFWRQPSPFVSPMASGDNNSAAAPDLLASITLQDQLIPVKITFVTEG